MTKSTTNELLLFSIIVCQIIINFLFGNKFGNTLFFLETKNSKLLVYKELEAFLLLRHGGFASHVGKMIQRDHFCLRSVMPLQGIIPLCGTIALAIALLGSLLFESPFRINKKGTALQYLFYLLRHGGFEPPIKMLICPVFMRASAFLQVVKSG